MSFTGSTANGGRFKISVHDDNIDARVRSKRECCKWVFVFNVGVGKWGMRVDHLNYYPGGKGMKKSCVQ